MRRTATPAGRAGLCARPPSRSRRASTAARRRGATVGSDPLLISASARHSATSSAAEEDRPAPRGTPPLISTCAPTSGQPARASSATMPRTKARQPRTRLGLGGVELVVPSQRAGVDAGCAGARGAGRRRLGADGDALGDRERQRESFVVVGVLADQVDAAGGERAAALSRHVRSPRAALRLTPPAACRR